MSRRLCTEVTQFCTVDLTVYGYRPDLAGNAFFLAAFAVILVAQTFLGFKYRTWSWLAALFLGCALEFIGYIGRIMMNRNPWSDIAFRMQIACLILGPSFISAGIDLVLKWTVVTFGSKYSRIPAKWYTWLFIGADIFAILLQAAGGGIASGGTNGNEALANAGNNLMLAGIIIQVAQLVLFGIVTAEYAIRTWIHRHELVEEHGSFMTPKESRKFRWFALSCLIAYIGILARCCYRIPELAQGWGGPLMRDEVTFLVLDGMMILIASIFLTIFHPGYCFPIMSGRHRSRHNAESLVEKK